MGGLFKKKNPPPDDEDPVWRGTYDAREKLYERHFGPFPEDVQKLRNLIEVWPGGCLVQFPATKLGTLWVHSSFGLSNSDMPNSVTLQTYHRDEASGRSEATLVARTPRAVPAGLAGFGYEVLLLTEGPGHWPLRFLNWVVQREILKDLDVLGCVNKNEGFLIEDIALGDDQSSHFFVSRAQQPLPATLQLPAGNCHLLVATAVTREEVDFALLEGGGAPLLEKLMASEVGQKSRLNRPSIIQF